MTTAPDAHHTATEATQGETANRTEAEVVPLRPDPSASERTRAREGTPETAVTQRDRFAWVIRLGRTHRPPEIWSERRPSLRDLWHYAAYGEWTGKDTAGRTFGQIYAFVVALPSHAVGYLALWIIERPSRFLAAWVVFVLFALTPPGHFVLSVLAAIARWFLSPF